GTVRRTEPGVDQPARPPRIPVAIVRQRIGGNRRATLELIGTAVLHPLLLAEGLYDQSGGLLPRGVETRAVARRSPVTVRQPHREAQRIDLPLALVQFRLHARQVLGPRAAGGTVV